MGGLERLEWRAPSLSDLPAWAALLAAIEAVDRTGEVVGEQELAALLGLSYVDPARDARLVLAPGGEPIAFGTVLCIPSPRQRRVTLEGAVRPDWRDRGVGSALVRWQVRRGLDLGAQHPADRPGWLELAGGDRDTARRELFRDHGFEPLRHYFEMRKKLHEPLPDPVLADALELVTFEPSRDEATRLAHNEAFEDHWASDVLDRETWTTWVTGHHEFRRDLSFLVLDGDDVVGYALSSTHPADWPGRGFTEGWTHQLGVRRPWRGRGVARALLHATLRAFAAEGLEFAALDVDADNPTGALALYERAGYRRERCRVAWGRDLD